MTTTVGSGSRFDDPLPLVVSPEVADAPADLDNTTGERQLQRLAGVRILFAEDNDVNQMVMEAMLRPEGPVVTTVSDGRLAVEQVREQGGDAFDVVLMDIQMPEMDGYEATRLILQLAPDLPIIGQTAHVLQEAIQRCQQAGMVTHLAKPIDRHELIAAILRYARPREFMPERTSAPAAGVSG